MDWPIPFPAQCARYQANQQFKSIYMCYGRYSLVLTLWSLLIDYSPFSYTISTELGDVLLFPPPLLQTHKHHCHSRYHYGELALWYVAPLHSPSGRFTHLHLISLCIQDRNISLHHVEGREFQHNLLTHSSVIELHTLGIGRECDFPNSRMIWWQNLELVFFP